MRLFTVEKIGKHLVDVQAAIHRAAMPIPTFKVREGDLPLAAAPTHLENGHVSFTLDERGQVASVYDKLNAREVLALGTRGNGLTFAIWASEMKTFKIWFQHD